jgi:biopolymer transport protein ExbD
MSSERLRLPLAAPTAGLLLILSLCAFWFQRPSAVGLDLPLPKVRVDRISNCDFLSDRDIVVQLKKNGSTWINETRMNPEELGPRLTRIYENRAERFALFIPDHDVSFEQFATVYSTITRSASTPYVELITPGLSKEFSRCPEGVHCGLDWPDGSYQPCVWINMPPIRGIKLRSPVRNPQVPSKKTTADPSTAPGAKNAPDFAQDDKSEE